MNTNVLRIPDMSKKFGVAPNTIRNWVKAGILPPPISLGSRFVGWLSSDIDKLLADRAAEARK